MRDALKTGPMGTQETAKGVKGVESCLNLDIFRPATKEQNLPVLYFIHGGNNQNGAANQVNLSQFAKRANVVVVSINYRLGALGYNPLPAVHHGTKVESSGNYGFLDALQGLDGTVLPKDGFKTKKWNEVPLIMTTGTDEFSLYTRINPYFAPSVKDKTVFTDEKKYAEFTFSKKYGSEMYRLFNAEASAEQMLDRYKAPIYTMTIAYGNNPELVGPETAFLSGSVHGIWIPFVTGYATSTTASYPKGSFDNPGALDLTRKVQQYIGNFMWDGNPNGQGLPTWNQWTSTKTGPSNLVVNADGEKANIQMTDTRSSYDEVFKEMEADKTVDKKDKEAIIHNVLNGRWWSKPLDQHFGTKTK